MTKIVKFSVSTPQKLGPKKARKRRKPNLEDFGQLNLFTQPEPEGRVIHFPKTTGFFEEALRLDEAGHLARAEEHYLLAASHGDSAADAYCNLGIMKHEQKEPAAGIDYLTRALAADPRHFEAHYNLANLYSELGHYQLAKTHYEVAISIDPDFPDSYYNLGLVFISLNRFDDALVILRNYLEHASEEEHQIAVELIKTLKALA